MEKESGGGGVFSEMLGGFMEIVSTIWEGVMEIAPKVLSFVLWCLLAMLVLPCVFVAGNIYPMWQEWGEEL